MTVLLQEKVIVSQDDCFTWQNDRELAKLMKVWKSESFLEAKLEKKYGRQAAQRAKEAMRKQKKSASNPIAAVAKKVTDKFSKN